MSAISFTLNRPGVWASCCCTQHTGDVDLSSDSSTCLCEHLTSQWAWALWDRSFLTSCKTSTVHVLSIWGGKESVHLTPPSNPVIPARKQAGELGGIHSRVKVDNNSARFWWVLLMVQSRCHGERGIKQTEQSSFRFWNRPPLLLMCNSALTEWRKHWAEDILFDSELHQSKC